MNNYTNKLHANKCKNFPISRSNTTDNKHTYCITWTIKNRFFNLGKIKEKEWYLGFVLIISHSSIFIAQSGPVSVSLVALSAKTAALLAIFLYSVQLLVFLQTKNPPPKSIHQHITSRVINIIRKTYSLRVKLIGPWIYYFSRKQ